MPIKSKSQYGLMQAVLHGKTKKMKHGAGPTPEVAKEFISKTSSSKRSKFAKALKRKE